MRYGKYEMIMCSVLITFTLHVLTVQGVTMTIRGEEKLVRGGVLFILADTLAAHAIGGFKVGVGFSLRKCRVCMATQEQLSTKVRTYICTTVQLWLAL